jgi:hypothetical protein|tara:strand:+ start:219 stop:386 length:168 start_codon:yes stop_codon:yes gene_type:complete
MSDTFNVKEPLELPKTEYDQGYFFRLINQLRLKFNQIQSPIEVRAIQQTFDWYIS